MNSSYIVMFCFILLYNNFMFLALLVIMLCHVIFVKINLAPTFDLLMHCVLCCFIKDLWVSYYCYCFCFASTCLYLRFFWQPYNNCYIRVIFIADYNVFYNVVCRKIVHFYVLCFLYRSAVLSVYLLRKWYQLHLVIRHFYVLISVYYYFND